ncbi:MAG: YtxH domain-containing protein [Bryobacteraceae bacterium]|jgi:gas vesicle protein
MDNREFGCFLVGVGVGVGFGILGATQPGKQVRKRLKAKAEETGEYLKERGAALGNSAANLVGRVKASTPERRLDQEALQRMDGEGGADRAAV